MLISYGGWYRFEAPQLWYCIFLISDYSLYSFPSGHVIGK
jgi:hypothetical protein